MSSLQLHMCCLNLLIHSWARNLSKFRLVLVMVYGQFAIVTMSINVLFKDIHDEDHVDFVKLFSAILYSDMILLLV